MSMIEELDPLTQMRVRIAILQGWTFHHKPYGCRIRNPDGKYFVSSFINNKMLDFYDVPNYPQSREDALTLVDKLLMDEYAVEMISEPAIRFGWKVTIGSYGAKFASTLEEAICLAYIAFQDSLEQVKGES